MQDSNTGVRRKRSGKLRRFLSITSNDQADGDIGSFHSAISSSFFSPSASSLFQSAISVDTFENLKRLQPTQHLSLAQRLTQHLRPSENQIEEKIVNISNLQPPEETAITSREPPITKPTPALIDVSAQTSLTLTGQQFPTQVHTTGESEVRLPPLISQPEIGETPSRQFIHQLSLQDASGLPRSGSTTDEGPSEKETTRSFPKRRFFETSPSGTSYELKQPQTNEEAEEKSKKQKKQYNLNSNTSATTIDSQSDGSVKTVESNYDNDRGGYASEVDDVIDDSLKRRINQRKEKEAREKESESHETVTKDVEQGKSGVRKTHSMSSRLETNLKVGTAFVSTYYSDKPRNV